MACKGSRLGSPGWPIAPWSRRTGAPQTSATGRDRNLSPLAPAHETVRHWEEQYGTVTRGAEATTQVERPVRHQMDTSEWRSNDS
jgi:hypothetical protein